ncbi:FAD-dependent oxidoreductase, partial [Nodularia spumigena]|uniref:FAD-dependent oxidoreductase n=1 Tax=Nodularia spumigena TaxID=70799 RepID=UPI002B1F03BD
MVIGVVGASLAGLAVARSLGKQGHQVLVFEKSSTWSGRFTTLKAGNDQTPVDVHIPYIDVKNESFKALVDELVAKNLMKAVESNVSSYVNGEISGASMEYEGSELYATTKGMAAVAQYMARYCDVKFDAEVVGITYIGDNTKKKAPWMINLVSNEVFELDAVVIAVPAPQALAILENAQDETSIRRAIANINEMRYDARYSVVATYPNKSLTDWSILEIGGNDVELVVNESIKNGSKDLILTLHSSNEFFQKAVHLKENEIIDLLLKNAASIVGDFVYNPEKTVIVKRKYVKPERYLEPTFINIEGLN